MRRSFYESLLKIGFAEQLRAYILTTAVSFMNISKSRYAAIYDSALVPLALDKRTTFQVQ